MPGSLFADSKYPTMASIADSKNNRRLGPGRPRTGIGKAIGLRLYPDLEAKLARWIRAQPTPQPSQPEAIRRLLEQALAVATPTMRDKAGSRRKAVEMAGRTIDRLGDPGATNEERAHRKRNLIKGPREFREVRGDRPKTKK